MQRPDLTTLACVNADCQYYGHTGQDNLTIRKVYGKDNIRLLRCSKCHEEFSERRNTALLNTKVSEAKAESIIDHLDEGNRVRATSRLTKSSKATVTRLLKTSGRHAHRFHHQGVQGLRPKAIEFDEQWSFVKKKQKNCSPEESHQSGDFWDHTAIAPDSKLIVSLVVGKRTKDRTQELVSDTQSRLQKGHLPTLLSDGYEGYEPPILEAFGRRYKAPQTSSAGRPRLDMIRWPQGLAYAQIIKSTKEKITDGIHLKVIRGKAKVLHTLSLLGYNKVNTSTIERHNGTSRLHNQRKVRKTLAFSKSHLYHGWMSWFGGAVQLLPCSWQLEDQRRKRLSSSDTCDGLRTDGSHLVDSRVAPDPGLGGEGSSQDTTPDVRVYEILKLPYIKELCPSTITKKWDRLKIPVF